MNFHSSLFLLWQSLLQVRCQLYLKGEGRECSKRPTSAAAMYLTRISSLTMQVNRSCFNHSLCFGKDADVQTEWDLFPALFYDCIDSYKIFYKVCFLFKTFHSLISNNKRDLFCYVIKARNNPLDLNWVF